ncbi:MAG: hypothetical protein U0T83_10950 [Bacteriovoracaceae bacterium]
MVNIFDNRLGKSKSGYCAYTSKIYLVKDGLVGVDAQAKLKKHFDSCEICMKAMIEIDQFELTAKAKIPWEKPDSMIIEQLELETNDLLKKYEAGLSKKEKVDTFTKIKNFIIRKPLDENRY